MAGVYARKKKLWLRYKDATGVWRSVSSGLSVGKEAAAQKMLEKLNAKIKAGEELGADGGPVTVRLYGKRWVLERERRGLHSWKDDETRLRKHVYPHIGSMELASLRPRHIRDMMRRLEAAGKLAPRTLRNIYAACRNMMTDALVDELLEQNPCVLKRHHVPPNIDRKPGWRDTAVFTRQEFECLVFDHRIPGLRRAIYATLGMAGIRAGEASARKWRDIDFDMEPMGKMAVVTSYNTDSGRIVDATKVDGVVRYVPLHPTLALVLKSWRHGGWQAFMGREPTADDLLFPSSASKNRCRSNSIIYHDLQDDLVLIGFRTRRIHDLRRTFISLSRSAGARTDIVKWISHGPGKSIVDIYTSFPWPALCAEIAKLDIGPLSREVMEGRASAAGGQ